MPYLLNNRSGFSNTLRLILASFNLAVLYIMDYLPILTPLKCDYLFDYISFTYPQALSNAPMPKLFDITLHVTYPSTYVYGFE